MNKASDVRQQLTNCFRYDRHRIENQKNVKSLPRASIVAKAVNTAVKCANQLENLAGGFLGIAVGAKAVLVEQVVKRWSGDTEQLGGFGNIAVTLGQRNADRL